MSLQISCNGQVRYYGSPSVAPQIINRGRGGKACLATIYVNRGGGGPAGERERSHETAGRTRARPRITQTANGRHRFIRRCGRYLAPTLYLTEPRFVFIRPVTGPRPIPPRPLFILPIVGVRPPGYDCWRDYSTVPHYSVTIAFSIRKESVRLPPLPVVRRVRCSTETVRTPRVRDR